MKTPALIPSPRFRPFIVFSLPRSRSYWLSRFLSYRGVYCAHEEMLHMRGLDDIRSWFSLPFGTVETGAAPFWRIIVKYRPDIAMATIRRPVSEVVASLEEVGCGWPGLAKIVRREAAKLDQIEARCRNVLSVSYDSLSDETGCARLFEHLLPYRHDHQWWAAMAQQNLQVNIAAKVLYARAHEPQGIRLANLVRDDTMRDLRGGRLHGA